MAGRIPIKQFSVSSKNYSLNSPKDGDLYSLSFYQWEGRTPTKLYIIKIPFLHFVVLGFKALGSEAVKKHVPHLYIGRTELPPGRIAWSSKVIKMRRKILSLAGQWEEPLPLDKRDILQGGEKHSFAGIDFCYDPKDGTINLSGNTFTLKAIAEVFAIVLRDKLVESTDKRRYVPWLVNRPLSDFDGMYLKENCTKLQRALNWRPIEVESDSPPPNIPATKDCLGIEWSDTPLPSDVHPESEDKSGDGDAEDAVDVFAILDTNRMNSEQDFPIWAMYRVEGGYRIGAVFQTENSELYYLDEDYPEVTFESFAQLLLFLVEIALSEEFRAITLPGEQVEDTQFRNWLTRGKPNRQMVDAMGIVKLVLNDLPERTVPHALVCGDSQFVTEDDGRIVWRYAGELPVVHIQQVMDLILLALSDTRTQENQHLYLPEGVRALSQECVDTLEALASANSFAKEQKVPDTELELPVAEVPEVAPASEVATAVVEVVPEPIPVAPITPKPIAPVNIVPVMPARTGVSPVSEPIVAQMTGSKADEIVIEFQTAFRAGAKKILAAIG